MTAGRKLKLESFMTQAIAQVIADGGRIEDACLAGGISISTFYAWLNRGYEIEAALETPVLTGRGKKKSMKLPAPPEPGSDDAKYLEFSQAITRAQGAAKRAALRTINIAMNPSTLTGVTVETYSETRLRKGENGEDVPYTYTRTRKQDHIQQVAGDWRAAAWLLERLYPDEFGAKAQIDMRVLAVQYIRNGQVSFEALAEALNDRELAAAYFAEAGVPLSSGTGGRENQS